MATKKKAPAQKPVEQNLSELEQYLQNHGLDYDPESLDPGSVDKYEVNEADIQRFAGDGYRPDLFAYYYTESEYRVKTLRPKGWLVVPKGEVFMPACNSDSSIIICRPLAVHHAAKSKQQARNAASGRANSTKRTQINDHSVMTTKSTKRKFF